MMTLIFTSADSEIEKADLEGEGLAIHMIEQRRVEKATYGKCQGNAPSAPGVADRQARGMEPEGAKQGQQGGTPRMPVCTPIIRYSLCDWW